MRLMILADGPVDEALQSVIAEIKNDHGAVASPIQILLKWALQRGDIVITTSSKPSRMQEQIAITNLPPLTEAQLKRIDEAGSRG